MKRYIHMRNWSKHQNYRRPSPRYINNFTSLLHDEDYLNLTPQQRSLLHGLWLKYAETNGKVPENTRWLSQQLALRVTKPMLESLNHAGWTFTASTHGWQLSPPVAVAETEAETETEAEKSSKEEPPLAKQGATVENDTDEPNASPVLVPALEVVSMDEFRANRLRELLSA